MDFAFVVISSIFQKEKYNLTNVTLFIEQNYKDFKYYANYLRKTPSKNIIYRFYKKNEDRSKVTLSVLPAFVLSRKQKSIRIFFDLLKIYSEKNITIECLWKYFDNSNHFKSLTTLRSYFKMFIFQLDNMLKVLTKEILLLNNKNKYPDILPNELDIIAKLTILFKTINQLLKILHEKNIQTLLTREAPFFLHYFLFIESNIYLFNFP